MKNLHLLFFLLVFLPISASLTCEEKCEPEKCQKLVEGCQKTILDPCKCCKICVRQVGESCGNSSEVCDTKLQCRQNDHLNETGICEEMHSDSCENAQCQIAFHPRCPDDSMIVHTPPPPGECCGQPGKCYCDLQKCAALLPKCDKDQELILKQKAIGEPGKCCDIYVCKKKDKKCHCPPSRSFDGDEECPPDSFRPPEHVTADSCCPIKQGCKCRGLICRPAQCADGEEVAILKRGTGSPGRCCDEFECRPKVATHKCGTYKEGDVWQNNSSCELCNCKKALVMCKKMSCATTPERCTWIAIPEGECCPVCLGCQTDSLEKKKINETWQTDDCTSCTCSADGAHVCTKHMCKTDCENPRKIKGQCCPVCDEPTIVRPPATCPSLEHCTLRCANGLRRDNVGCYECECLPEDVPTDEQCQELTDVNCDKQCAHGYLKDNDGCLSCKCAKCPPLHQCFKHCLYGFETNSAGCPLCKCRAKLLAAEKKEETAVKNGGGLSNGKCVSFSPDGHQIERDGGEWWSDGCRHCFCENKQEFCSLISCPSKPSDCSDELWLQKEGECCASCQDSKSKQKTNGNAVSARQQKHEHTVCQSPGTGRLFTDGETWKLAPCVSCTCRVGHVLCKTRECPPIPCKNPKRLSDEDCCPVCPDIIPPTPLNLPPNTEPVICTDELGTAHLVGSTWRKDDCTSCICGESGDSECFKETCDDMGCRGNPLVIKGKCCPVCSDALSSSAVCSYQSSVYSIGEQWQDGYCSNCSCVAGGQTVCRQMVCPACQNTVPIEGHCCPLCKDAGWAPHGIGNESAFFAGHPRVSTESSSGPTTAVSLLTVSMMSLAVVGMLLVLLFVYKKSRNSNKLHKFNEVGQMSSGGTSTVRLSASKTIGSMPRLVDWKDTRENFKPEDCELLKTTGHQHIRHDSQNSDDQSDSLLSTMSDTSTTPSTVSSGNAPVSDTQPLTRRFPV